MAKVRETPRMMARDAIKSLTTLGQYLFGGCQYAKCGCGNVKEDCRDRYLRWREGLVEAEKKANEIPAMNMIKPVMGGIRIDPMGHGGFMAPRGDRLHRGLDLVVVPGEPVFSLCNLKFERIAKPDRSGSYSGVMLKNELIWIRMFYIEPDIDLIGHDLYTGKVIGRAQDISKKYGGDMIPHIHVEMMLPAMTALRHDGHVYGNEMFVDPELFF